MSPANPDSIIRDDRPRPEALLARFTLGIIDSFRL